MSHTSAKPRASRCAPGRRLRGRARDVRRVPRVTPASRSSQAGNGMEALEHAADAAPDIILMDLSLPVMDGWEATRRLKKDDSRTAAIPVVALTGHALAGISEGAKQAGCDAFVTKPCLPEDLVKEIREVLDRPAPRRTPQERNACRTAQPGRNAPLRGAKRGRRPGPRRRGRAGAAAVPRGSRAWRGREGGAAGVAQPRRSQVPLLHHRARAIRSNFGPIGMAQIRGGLHRPLQEPRARWCRTRRSKCSTRRARTCWPTSASTRPRCASTRSFRCRSGRSSRPRRHRRAAAAAADAFQDVLNKMLTSWSSASRCCGIAT